MQLRVWWIPQVPMKAFHYPVNSVKEGAILLDVLAKYDLFQYVNNVKPDYANAGGLQMWEDGEWVDWEDGEGFGIDEHMDEILGKTNEQEANADRS